MRMAPSSSNANIITPLLFVDLHDKAMHALRPAQIFVLLAACATQASTPTETSSPGTDVDTITHVDLDWSDVGEPSACVDPAPIRCEEKIGDNCYSAWVPSSMSGSSSEAFLLRIMSSNNPLVVIASCAGGRYFASKSIGATDYLLDGEAIVGLEHDPQGYTAFDATTYESVGGGFVTGASANAPCKRMWYGEREAFACMERASELLLERFELCYGPDATGDVCTCHVNELNDIQAPGCP